MKACPDMMWTSEINIPNFRVGIAGRLDLGLPWTWAALPGHEAPSHIIPRPALERDGWQQNAYVSLDETQTKRSLGAGGVSRTATRGRAAASDISAAAVGARLRQDRFRGAAGAATESS